MITNTFSFSWCMMPPLETHPPGDPSGGVFYLRIVLSPEEASRPWVFLNIFSYWEELLAPLPTPKLEGHPLSAVRDCLFNLFAATLHIGCRSSIRKLRKRHAVVTGTHNHGFYSIPSVGNIFLLCKYLSYAWCIQREAPLLHVTNPA